MGEDKGGTLINEIIHDYFIDYLFDWRDNLDSSTLTNPYSLGPIHIEQNLIINATPQGGAIRFDGTVYVDGYILITPDVVVYLNNNTIFGNNLYVKLDQETTIIGNGCIIAAPQIIFESSYYDDANVILWSINSSVGFWQTGGNLRGTALARTQIRLEPGAMMTWQRPPSDMPIPPFDFSEHQYRIIGWESTSQ